MFSQAIELRNRPLNIRVKNTHHTKTAPLYEEVNPKHELNCSVGAKGRSIPMGTGIAAQDNQLISREELANRWSFCVETLKRWEKAGKLPFLKLGKQIRYRLSTVEQIENGSEVLL